MTQDTEPKRIQRRRIKGWRMPEGAVYVGRGSRWGNPFRLIQSECGCWDVVDENDTTYILSPGMHTRGTCDGTSSSKRYAASEAVDLFASLYGGSRLFVERDPDSALVLAGKDLACWCPDDQPCHADVLLDYANCLDDAGVSQ